MNRSPTNIQKLGTILGIWAHPDDEAWSMAGIMALARQNDQRVACITATYGDAGQTADEVRWPQQQLRTIREKELEKSLGLCGVSEHYWLDYRDGALAQANSEEAINRIAVLCEKIQPDSIFTFTPDGMTGHDDHKTISKWAVAAAGRACRNAVVYGAATVEEDFLKAQKFNDAFNVFFNTAEPVLTPRAKVDLFVPLPDDVAQIKLASMEAHASQTSRMFASPEMRGYLEDQARTEHFVRL